MDIARLREDFEGLPPEEQMEFMASVGPAFCRSLMADPVRRHLMMTRCLREGCRPIAAAAARLRAARATARAVAAGLRAGAARLRQAPAA